MSTETVQGAAFRIGDSTPSLSADASDHPEAAALSATERAEAAFLGVVIAVLLIAVAFVAAALFTAATFGYSLGELL